MPRDASVVAAARVPNHAAHAPTILIWVAMAGTVGAGGACSIIAATIQGSAAARPACLRCCRGAGWQLADRQSGVRTECLERQPQQHLTIRVQAQHGKMA